MTLKARLARIERHLESMKPKGRFHVVWPGDDLPPLGPNDTLIRVEYTDCASIEDESSRWWARSGMSLDVAIEDEELRPITRCARAYGMQAIHDSICPHSTAYCSF